jgi:hypothetical protein
VAHSVATFARSFEGFPKRAVDDITLAASSAKHDAYEKKAKYRGSKLFI